MPSSCPNRELRGADRGLARFDSNWLDASDASDASEPRRAAQYAELQHHEKEKELRVYSALDRYHHYLRKWLKRVCTTNFRKEECLLAA